MLCKECHTPVKGSGAIYCSGVCKETAQEKRKKKRLDKNSESITGIEGKDFVTCQWCEARVKRVYGIHMKNHHPGKTSFDYRKEFPGSSLTCSKDNERTSANSGLHMKEDKYRKMVSDKMKGEKNPNHKSKTTLATRKSRSPFSQDFVSYKNNDDKSAAVSNFVKKALKDRITETQLEYWVNKFGGDEERAKKEYSERQRTFTLEKCIQKYSEEIGFEVWKERQQKWSKKVEEKYRNGEFTRFCKHNYSNSELRFFETLLSRFNPKESYYCALPGNRQFFRHFKEEGVTLAYDFVVGKKIIEFNGDFWHCNPSQHEADYFNKMLGCTAKQKWEMDKKKLDLIKNAGYDVLVVWESDYRKDPDSVLEKCLSFLHD